MGCCAMQRFPFASGLTQQKWMRIKAKVFLVGPVLLALRPYITHLHIGYAVAQPGCEAYGDEHPRFGFPGSANDVDERVDFFTVLKEEGFFREKDPLVLSLEVKPWGDEDGNIILANTKRVINRAWALVEE